MKWLLLFFGVLTLSAAPVRVALIGDGSLVDPAVAALSSDDGLALLERNQIQAVLREHKLNAAALSAGTLAEYFPHTDVFAVFTPERLVVFHAKNGFRLWDGGPENPAEKIRLAIGKTTQAQAEYLSIVSVRDVGVPRVWKPKIEEVVTLLEQKLVQLPEIQMLERARLNAVTDERELTGKQFALVPSAKLLTLEFEPGSESRIVHVKILIRDLGGRTLGRCTQNDIFRDIPGGVISLQKQLTTILFAKTIASADAKAEAAKYFEEFIALTKSKHNLTPECTAKLEAALALAPDNPSYRYRNVRYRSELIRRLPYHERISQWRAQWERCRKFREDFPNYQEGVMYTEMVLPGLDRNRCHPDSPEYSLAEELLAQMRQYTEQEERIWFKAPRSPESIKTFQDLENFSHIQIRKCRAEYYISPARRLKEQLQYQHEFFKIAESYYTRHPEQRNKLEELFGREGHCLAIDVTKRFLGTFSGQEKIIADYLNSPAISDFMDFLSKSALPSLKRQHIFLKHMRILVNGPRDVKSYAAGLQTFFAELDQYSPRDLNAPDRPTHWATGGDVIYDWCFSDFVKAMVHDWRLFPAEKRRYQREHNKFNAWSSFEDAVRNGSLEELAEHTETMHRFNYDRMTKNRIGNLYGSAVNRLFDREGKFKNATAEKLFFEANANFTIQTKRYEELLGNRFATHRIAILLGASRFGTNTWMLFRRQNQPYLSLGRLSDDGGIFSLIDTPLANGSFAGKDDIIARRPAPIVCDSRYIAIGDRERNIHVYDLEQKRWTMIRDAAPTVIISLAVLSDRIWGLCGGNLRKADFCAMFSCRPDGSDRQIHFSTARGEPQNELDKAKIRELNSLTVFGKKLIFSATTENCTRVYCYSTEDKKFTLLKEFPFTGAGIDQVWNQNGSIYCFTLSHGERIYRIDPKRNTVEWIFNQTGNRYRFDPPEARPVILKGGGWQMNFPWAFHGKMLYSANYTPGVIRLDAPEKSPLLLLPGCPYVFETANGMLYLGHHRYFFIRENLQ